ncbi:MAG: hypothetical protein ACLQCB_05665 [Spirochaetia bacterium]
MQLKINGEQVSVTLEKEKTLAEVMQGVQAWLGAAGFVITGVKADGQDLLSMAPAIWGATAVESVQEIDVQVQHTADMKVEHWQTLDLWLGMLVEEVRAPGPTLEELLSNLPETVDGMKANPFLPSGADGLERFTRTFAGLGSAHVRRWSAEQREDAAHLIESLRGELSRRIADAAQPREALARRMSDLRARVDQLPEVSVLLQTGKDKAAMETVIGFTDTVQSVLALVPFLPPDQERGRLIADLNPVLRDLVAAFDAKDSVLIGDLLEYEVAPRVTRLMPLLEQRA